MKNDKTIHARIYLGGKLKQKITKNMPRTPGKLKYCSNHRTSCLYELSNFAKEQTAILFPVALLFLSISD